MSETSHRAESGAGNFDPDGIDPDAINALRHTFAIERKHTEGEPIKGWLSTLVWNTRNNYLSSPTCTFEADHVRMLVEGFMAEVGRLHAELDEAQLQSIEARNPGIDMEEVRRARAARTA